MLLNSNPTNKGVFFLFLKENMVGTHYKCIGEVLLMSTTAYNFAEKTINTLQLKKVSGAMMFNRFDIVSLYMTFHKKYVTIYNL